MEYSEWLHWYQEICRHFGYDPEKDYQSSILLDRLAKQKLLDVQFSRLFRSKDISVIGNGPKLKEILDTYSVKVPFVADSALPVFYLKVGIPNVIITDLDGESPLLLKCEEEGSMLVVHAHGDNMVALENIVPRIGTEILCTTQNVPFGNIYNFGGFTDGDRSAFLADHIQPRSIELVGFDFNNPVSKPGSKISVKKEKLNYARGLLQELAAERGKVWREGEIIQV
ncbi:MAG: 6-hydroxymethylpterin diphosphokinase MptE-like protein [Thermoplasmataceae archaeon]